MCHSSFHRIIYKKFFKNTEKKKRNKKKIIKNKITFLCNIKNGFKLKIKL